MDEKDRAGRDLFSSDDVNKPMNEDVEKSPLLDAGSDTEVQSPNNTQAYRSGGIFTMTVPADDTPATLSGQCSLSATAAKPFGYFDYGMQQPQNQFVSGLVRSPRRPCKSIQLTVPKLSSLRQKITTPFHCISNLPWRLAAKTECTKRTSNVKYFSVYIDCNPESESTLWSCDAVVEFRLISQKSSGTADFTRQFTNKFRYNSNNWGFPSFMEWSEITNPDRGFVREDKIVLEAQITVQKVVGVRQNPIYDFTSNQAPMNDGILVIDGVRLYISKSYLAYYSPVFQAMFYSNFVEHDMKEVPVEDVILKEFVEMLNVVFPSHAPVTAESVEYLLELGDRFEIQYVIDQCEKFLIETDEILTMTKLVWADQYCLANLQDVCIRLFKEKDDFRSLKNSEEYRSLSDNTKAALLEKMLKII